MRWYLCTLLVLLAGSLVLAGCVSAPIQRQEEESRSVDLGKAEMVRASIEMKAGELEVLAGTDRLLEGRFRYRGDVSKPIVHYSESGFRGNLTVRQGGATFTLSPGGETHNRWNLRLNEDVPLNLDVTLGAGESKLDLRGLYLRGLEVRVGAGEVDLNLGGHWRRGFDANIRGGLGEVEVRLPRDVAVEAFAQGGIGEISAPGFRRSGRQYTHEPEGGSPVTIRLDVRGGIGQIKLRLED